MPLLRMRVLKYVPKKFYGFLRDEANFDVFFHLATFQPGADVQVAHCPNCPGTSRCQVTVEAPPPILGELVDVDVDITDLGGRAPRADHVERVHPPTMIVGKVESFDPLRQYGFAMGSDKVSYHLHESEILEGLMPLSGDRVVFYPGLREGRPRACHVRVCR